WGVGLRACGGSAGYVDGASPHAGGSPVESATPPPGGGAGCPWVLSRAVPGRGPGVRAGGGGNAVRAAPRGGLGLLIVVAAAVGRVPLWPAPILIGAVAAAVAIGMRLSTRVAGRVAAVLQAFRSPRHAFELSRWVAYSYVFRVAAGVAIVA